MDKRINRLKLAQFGNLEILAKQVVEGFITGLHKSPFHGFSVEFAEHRLYNKGESTRHIDWKLFARSDKLFVKKYEEETNLRCQMVIDTSSSMFYQQGTEISKIEFVVYAVASLIELLKKQRDAVGITFFDDRLEKYLPAKSSPAHHRLLYHELEKLLVNYQENTKKTTHFSEALNEVAELLHKRSLVFIFTDLMDDPSKKNQFIQALQHLKYNKHEVVLFHVIDQQTEQLFELENRPYTLVDMETGERFKLNPSAFKEKYKQSVEAHFQEIKSLCLNSKIDFVEADIRMGYEQVLIQYLLKRLKISS